MPWEVSRLFFSAGFNVEAPTDMYTWAYVRVCVYIFKFIYFARLPIQYSNALVYECSEINSILVLHKFISNFLFY